MENSRNNTFFVSERARYKTDVTDLLWFHYADIYRDAINGFNDLQFHFRIQSSSIWRICFLFILEVLKNVLQISYSFVHNKLNIKWIEHSLFNRLYHRVSYYSIKYFYSHDSASSVKSLETNENGSLQRRCCWSWQQPLLNS